MHFLTATSSLLALALPLIFASPLNVRDAVYSPEQSCKAASFGDFAWDVKDFYFNATFAFSTPSHQHYWADVTFCLTNPALTGNKYAYTVACKATSFDPNQFFHQDTWYDCDLPAAAGGNGKAKFSFDRPSGRLQVQQLWQCAEPGTTTTLNGKGETTLSLVCSEKEWKNPHWTLDSGELVSTRTITCDPVNAIIKPQELSAVA